MSCRISIAMTSSRGGTQIFLHATHKLIILPGVVVVERWTGGVLLILGVHDR